VCVCVCVRAPARVAVGHDACLTALDVTAMIKEIINRWHRSVYELTWVSRQGKERHARCMG
jgi:hypothetical protein